MNDLRRAHMFFDFRDWPQCENCTATWYENRHEHCVVAPLMERHGVVHATSGVAVGRPARTGGAAAAARAAAAERRVPRSRTQGKSAGHRVQQLGALDGWGTVVVGIPGNRARATRFCSFSIVVGRAALGRPSVFAYRFRSRSDDRFHERVASGTICRVGRDPLASREPDPRAQLGPSSSGDSTCAPSSSRPSPSWSARRCSPTSRRSSTTRRSPRVRRSA